MAEYPKGPGVPLEHSYPVSRQLLPGGQCCWVPHAAVALKELLGNSEHFPSECKQQNAKCQGSLVDQMLPSVFSTQLPACHLQTSTSSSTSALL